MINNNSKFYVKYDAHGFNEWQDMNTLLYPTSVRRT